MNRILLTRGTVVHPDRVSREDILIEDERISQLGSDLAADNGIDVLDCKDRLIFPGVIDAHTHMGVPIKKGRSADDFESGSRSALHGGVTTIIDFSVLEADQSLQESISQRQAQAASAVTDYGLHCNVTRFDPSLLAEIPFLISQGILSYKVFTTYEEAGMQLAYPQIRDLAEVLAREGGVLMVHAEDNAELQKAARKWLGDGPVEPIFHARSRPDEAEVVAIERMGAIADETGCRSYIVHLSSARGLEMASRFERLAIETCPQYLLLNESAYSREDGSMFVTSPPLRTVADQKALWTGLETGRIRVVGTDHCPFHRSDKPDGIPVQDIPNGLGGVETLFPVLLAQFLERGMDLTLLVRLLATNPAQMFGLTPCKGSLVVGADADVLVVDPERSSLDWLQGLVSTTDWNAYAGLPAIFPEQVFRRGEWVVQSGQLVDTTAGRFVPGRT